MKKATVSALQDAIDHWMRMQKNPRIEEAPGCYDCPLCERFGSDCVRDDGERCPLLQDGMMECGPDSLYLDAHRAWVRTRETRISKAMMNRWRKAAGLFIAHMKSLLPE